MKIHLHLLFGAYNPLVADLQPQQQCLSALCLYLLSPLPPFLLSTFRIKTSSSPCCFTGISYLAEKWIVQNSVAI